MTFPVVPSARGGRRRAAHRRGLYRLLTYLFNLGLVVSTVMILSRLLQIDIFAARLHPWFWFGRWDSHPIQSIFSFAVSARLCCVRGDRMGLEWPSCRPAHCLLLNEQLSIVLLGAEPQSHSCCLCLLLHSFSHLYSYSTLYSPSYSSSDSFSCSPCGCDLHHDGADGYVSLCEMVLPTFHVLG
jgi:hypothetical protein